MSEIMVSIVCNAYNHEEYIRETLNGFVNQITDFKYEILVYDDASTDRTAEIIREYEKNYPDLIKPIYQSENQYSKGKMPGRQNRSRAVGKYVALCEGDDYWCDENKLQMQVDYMEAHPKCSMCVHDTELIDGTGKLLGKTVNGLRKDTDYDIKEVIKADGGGLFQTSSVLVKREILLNRPTEYDIKGIGDYPNAIYASCMGRIHYFGKVMSRYRVGHSNSWSSRMKKNKQRLIEQYESEYNDLLRIDKLLGYKYRAAFRVPRGQRLFVLYKNKYGLLKLFLKPSDFWVVVQAKAYRVGCKIKKVFYKCMYH